jgi:peptidoglycan/LPS O-acetylase OafA/YrhL
MGDFRQMSMEVAIEGLLIVPRGFSLENALAAKPPALWFVLLLLQYYILFPLLFPLLRRIGPVAFAAASVAVTTVSSAWMVWALGDVHGMHGYIWSNWLPFRIAEFGVGMAMGYALIQHPQAVRRATSRIPVIAVSVIAGVAMHSYGSWIASDDGYLEALSYALIVAGLAVVMLNVIVMRPGLVLSSAPVRLLAFVGAMSYAALITNETFRVLNFYFLVQGWGFTAAWWYFIVALYVPLTVVLAYPLAAALGLLPPRTRTMPAPAREPAPALLPLDDPLPEATGG